MDEEETDAKKDPFKGQQWYRYKKQEGNILYTPKIIWSFLQYVMDARKLPIQKVLSELTSKSFFLIAATGLGKTVAVPPWLLFRKMHYEEHRPAPVIPGKPLAAVSPRIWVVEPRIAICQGMQAEMNRQWNEWAKKESFKELPLLFGAKTKVDNVATDAPIMFITTGIFAIYARKGVFKAGRDIVLIDEAHETLESDEAVELGVAICRMEGIEVHYMSATVDASEIPEQLNVEVVMATGARQLVWRYNTQRPLQECIVEIVDEALVQQDLESEFFPEADTEDNREIIRSVTERDRAKGMLVIINSFSSERSDARRVEKKLRETFKKGQIEVGLLASEVLKNPKRKAAYEAMLEKWKREKRKYVLIATSVVEMGVTLPELDFVVTMDAGFQREQLGTNALIQRIGRVGRQRPGIAYITQEVGAPYTKLTEEELNQVDALKPEPIQFPMKEGSVEALVYLSFERGWTNAMLLNMLQTKLRIPSFHKLEYQQWQNRILQERKRLWALDIGKLNPASLTPLGRQIERWVGRGNLEWAVRIEKATKETDSQKLFGGLFGITREAVRDRVGEQADDTLYMLALASLYAMLWDLRKEYIMREWAERILEQAMSLNRTADALLQFLRTLEETLALFFEIHPDAREGQTKEWHKALTWFLARTRNE